MTQDTEARLVLIAQGLMCVGGGCVYAKQHITLFCREIGVKATEHEINEIIRQARERLTNG